MSVVFSAIVPHPPVLIPEIGKDHYEKLGQTVKALKQLEQELYVSKPDTIVIISPHGQILDDAFSINLSSEYLAHFQKFGEHSIELKFKSDALSVQKIRSADEGNKSMPIVLSSAKELDYGFSVPLYYLTQHLKNVAVIPITYSGLPLDKHFAFGKFLHRQLSKIDKRFAVIASGDLAHTLDEESPGGYHQDGEVFDTTIKECVMSGQCKSILDIDPPIIKNAQEYGLRSIMILFGLLDQMEFEPEILSYESPFGVGYLVSRFTFQ